MRAIALRTGFEVQFYPMKWEEACEKAKKRRNRYYTRNEIH